jgi:aminoglycoside phosphotransferase (APT) family kinase protein
MPHPDGMEASPPGWPGAQAALAARIGEVLAREPEIAAAWVAGSLGEGAGDRWSDVDVHIAVEDSVFERVAGDHRRLVDAIGPTARVEPLGSPPAVVVVFGLPWERYDFHLRRLSQVRNAPPAGVRVLFDRVGVFPAQVVPPPGPGAPYWPEAVVNGFIYILGCAPIVAGRLEIGIGIHGVAAQRWYLMQLMLAENGHRLAGGIKRVNSFLTPDQREVIERQPPLENTVASVVEGHLAVAREFLPRARRLAAATGAIYPMEYEQATVTWVEGELGVRIEETPGVSTTFEPINAILTPPALQTFRELTGFAAPPEEVRFDGWSKLAILAPDRVFLFPRNHIAAEDVVREIAALRGLETAGVTVAPRLLGSWDEPDVYAYPFFCVERAPGRNWAELETGASVEQWRRLMASLGRAIAAWHRLGPGDLPSGLRQRFDRTPEHLAGFLAAGTVDASVEKAAVLLKASTADRDRWLDSARRVATMPHVLVHGDVCENQLIVDAEARVLAVVDWARPGIGHPLVDFDFGQWGFGIFAHEARFADFRRVLWGEYAAARGLMTPDWRDVHLVFSLAEAAYFAGREQAGQLDDWGRRRRHTTMTALEQAAALAGNR